MSGLHSEGHGNGWMSRYETLTDLLYEVRRRCRYLAVLGTSTLHPRHSLPADHLQLMEALAGGGALGSQPAAGRSADHVPPSLLLIALWWGRCALFACRETLGLLWLKGRYRAALRRLQQEPADVVMKSWCFSPESFEGSSDFYYGTVPHQLQARGMTCLLLHGDTRERNDGAFMRAILQGGPVRTVPEWLLVPLWAPLVTVIRQLVAALALRRLARRAAARPLARVAAAACRNSLQPITTRNTLLFDIARVAVKIWRAKVFVTLYEGQPWEQPAWHGAKAANPACVTVGYQHTVVMPHSLSLLSPNHGSWELSTPDVVLCLGEATQQMMAPGHRPHGSRLIPFGTPRRTANRPAVCGPQPGRRTILVVPETGVPREARLMFNFAMGAARRLPEYRFIFRCHPFAPFPVVQPHLEADPADLPNVEVSTRPISEDFARCSAVLYRGSSSVLYAVLHGLKPIYLEDATYPDVDPLFNMEGWRERVASPEELERVLRRVDAQDGEATAQWRRAAAYVEAYARPVTDAAIDRFLDAVGLADLTAATTTC